MPPRRRAAPGREPSEPEPEAPAVIDLTALVAALAQLGLHVHVHVPVAGATPSAAPAGQPAPAPADPILGGEGRRIPSAPAPRPQEHDIGSSDEDAEPDIRCYTVWHVPGHPNIHGIFIGPHPTAWRSIATFLPNRRLDGSGASLARHPSEALARQAYRRERGRHPGLPREPVMHYFR